MTDQEVSEGGSPQVDWLQDYFMPAGVLIALFGLFFLWRSVSAVQQELLTEGDARRAEYAELSRRIQAIESELNSLNDRTERAAQASGEQPFYEVPDVLLQGQIVNGLYILKEKSVQIRYPQGRDGYTANFTIYHIKTTIPGVRHPWNLNIGLAFSGLTTTPQFYMDVGSDNVVDVGLMQEFVRFIPFGRVVLKTVTESNSQAVYNVFLTNFQSAEYTPIQQIAGSESKVARQLWAFVKEQADAIGAWLDSREGQSLAEVLTR